MSSSRPIQNSPWPDPTPAASTSSSSSRRSTKRRRIQHKALEARASTSKSARRQIVADQSEVQTALVNCEFYSGNNVFSCFPTAQTVIPQHQWASFVWNSRRPDLTQTNLVDIFLFRGDSGQQILHFPNTSNPTDQAGLLTAQVNDSWWGTDGKNWNGSNISYPFYWVIIRSDKTLDGNQVAQPTFTAVREYLRCPRNFMDTDVIPRNHICRLGNCIVISLSSFSVIRIIRLGRFCFRILLQRLSKVPRHIPHLCGSTYLERLLLLSALGHRSHRRPGVPRHRCLMRASVPHPSPDTSPEGEGGKRGESEFYGIRVTHDG